MIKSDFQGSSYRNSREMADAIAEAWLTAGGFNSSDDIAAALASSTPEALAAEVIEVWGLADETDDPIELSMSEEMGEPTPTWMSLRDLDRADIVAAFDRYEADPTA